MSEPVYWVEVHPAAVEQLERLYRSNRKLAVRFDQHIRAPARLPFPKDVVSWNAPSHTTCVGHE